MNKQMPPFASKYFLSFLQSVGTFIKVKPTNFFYRPKCGDVDHQIGFDCYSNVKAGELSGKIKMRCVLDLPEDWEAKIEMNDPNLQKFLDNLEFIRTGEELSYNKIDI